MNESLSFTFELVQQADCEFRANFDWLSRPLRHPQGSRGASRQPARVDELLLDEPAPLGSAGLTAARLIGAAAAG